MKNKKYKRKHVLELLQYFDMSTSLIQILFKGIPYMIENNTCQLMRELFAWQANNNMVFNLHSVVQYLYTVKFCTNQVFILNDY